MPRHRKNSGRRCSPSCNRFEQHRGNHNGEQAQSGRATEETRFGPGNGLRRPGRRRGSRARHRHGDGKPGSRARPAGFQHAIDRLSGQPGEHAPVRHAGRHQSLHGAGRSTGCQGDDGRCLRSQQHAGRPEGLARARRGQHARRRRHARRPLARRPGSRPRLSLPVRQGEHCPHHLRAGRRCARPAGPVQRLWRDRQPVAVAAHHGPGRCFLQRRLEQFPAQLCPYRQRPAADRHVLFPVGLGYLGRQMARRRRCAVQPAQRRTGRAADGRRPQDQTRPGPQRAGAEQLQGADLRPGDRSRQLPALRLRHQIDDLGLLRLQPPGFHQPGGAGRNQLRLLADHLTQHQALLRQGGRLLPLRRHDGDAGPEMADRPQHLRRRQRAAHDAGRYPLQIGLFLDVDRAARPADHAQAIQRRRRPARLSAMGDALQGGRAL